VAVFGGGNIEKYLWIEFEKPFFLRTVKQSLTLSSLRKIVTRRHIVVDSVLVSEVRHRVWYDIRF
jgi:hypothetical protein